MNPSRFDDLIATRHPNNLLLPRQRRDDSDSPDTMVQQSFSKEVH